MDQTDEDGNNICRKEVQPDDARTSNSVFFKNIADNDVADNGGSLCSSLSGNADLLLAESE